MQKKGNQGAGQAVIEALRGHACVTCGQHMISDILILQTSLSMYS